MKMTRTRRLAGAALLLLFCAAAAPAGADGVDPRRLLLGIDLSTDDFSLDLDDISADITFAASFEAEILPSLCLAAGGWLRAAELDYVFGTGAATSAFFTGFGFDLSALVTVWRRDYTVPVQRVVREERINDRQVRIWYYWDTAPYHGSIGLFAKYPLAFSPGEPAQLTPLSALVVGAFLEARQVAVPDMMRFQVYFQRVSPSLPFFEAMLLGSQALFFQEPVGGALWVEARLLAKPAPDVVCGMWIGLALGW